MLFSFQKKTGNHFKQLCIKSRQVPGCRNTAYDTGAGEHVICRVSLPCHQCGSCNDFWDPSRVYIEHVTQPADLPVACFLKCQDSCNRGKAPLPCGGSGEHFKTGCRRLTQLLGRGEESCENAFLCRFTFLTRPLHCLCPRCEHSSHSLSAGHVLPPLTGSQLTAPHAPTHSS